MKNKLEEILSKLSEIKYGFLYKEEIINETNPNYSKLFSDKYILSMPEETLTNKAGVCWDQVELERYYLEKSNIQSKSYFIVSYETENLPTHTFLITNNNNKYYWLENSWNKYKGVHEYDNIDSLFADVKDKFVKSINSNNKELIFVYEYDKPTTKLNCNEFYNHCESGTLLRLNKPLYFYHLVDKNADMTNGLLSLQYMYNNKMYNLFDKYVSKYHDRITKDWNLNKYQGKDYLTREEYLDALKEFRGEYGTYYLYFFRFPLYKKLGKKITELLENKDIYRININDEYVQKFILDIFYGYERSNSDNKLLDKRYYETITEEDYFRNYNDELKMNFSTLNHIGIAFKDGYCPIELLEKVDGE